MMLTTRLPKLGRKPAELASPSPYPMTVLPTLKGGSAAKVWQPMSALMWVGPSSFSRILIALKIGRSGQPVQKPGVRAGRSPPISLPASSFSASSAFMRASTGPICKAGGAQVSRKPTRPRSITSEVYSPPIGRTSLPITRVFSPAFRRIACRACSM